MSTYLLEPMDTQFYRSTLPFDAGSDGHTETLCFPWPRTLYGAVRALAFSDCTAFTIGKTMPPTTISKCWGDWYQSGSTIIKGPVLFRKNNGFSDILLPMPADLVLDKDRQKKIYRCAPDEKTKLEDFSDCQEHPGLCRIKISDTNSIKCKSGENIFFLLNDDVQTGEILKKYLTHDLHGDIDNNFLKCDNVLISEKKIGIKRSGKTHASEEGFLFTASHYRLNSQPDEDVFGYWFQIVDNPPPALPVNRFLKLGGENRLMKITCVDNGDNLDSRWTINFKDAVIQKIINNDGRFKLYLITPGIFEHGRSYPSNFIISDGKIIYQTNGHKSQLIGMSINQHEMVGGWNIVKKCPKALDAAVPSGSVYFFKIENWPKDSTEKEITANFWFDHFNFNSICSGEPAKEGFGITLTGGWHV